MGQRPRSHPSGWQSSSDCPIILFTAETGEELWSETLRLGVDGYLAKYSRWFRASAMRCSLGLLPHAPAGDVDRPRCSPPPVGGVGSVGVFSATLDGEILEANPSFAAMLGLFDPEEAAWSSFPGLFAGTGGGRELARPDRHPHGMWATWKPTAQGRRSLGVGAGVLLHGSSRTRTRGRDRIQGVITGTDAHHAIQEAGGTSRRSRAVQRRAGEVHYVVSHDLQQPLTSFRAISNCSRTAVGKPFRPKRLPRSCGRQGAASRKWWMPCSATRGQQFTSVDLADVFEEVEAGCGRRSLAPGPRLPNDSLPFVEGDPSQIRPSSRTFCPTRSSLPTRSRARILLGVEERDDQMALYGSRRGHRTRSGELRPVCVRCPSVSTPKRNIRAPGSG